MPYPAHAALNELSLISFSCAAANAGTHVSEALTHERTEKSAMFLPDSLLHGIVRAGEVWRQNPQGPLATGEPLVVPPSFKTSSAAHFLTRMVRSSMLPSEKPTGVPSFASGRTVLDACAYADESFLLTFRSIRAAAQTNSCDVGFRVIMDENRVPLLIQKAQPTSVKSVISLADILLDNTLLCPAGSIFGIDWHDNLTYKYTDPLKVELPSVHSVKSLTLLRASAFILRPNERTGVLQLQSPQTMSPHEFDKHTTLDMVKPYAHKLTEPGRPWVHVVGARASANAF